MSPELTRLLESVGTATETPAREALSDPTSMTGRVDAVNTAFYAAYPSSEGGPMNYVEEIYDNRVLARIGEDVMQIPYTVQTNGTSIIWGDPKKVKISINAEPLEDEATEAHDVREALDIDIIESADGEKGWIWRVTMIRPGISKNNTRYRPEVLQEAVALYEGAKAFDGHRTESERKASAAGKLAGWHDNVEVAPDGSLQSDFHISESRDDLRQLFLTAWRSQRPGLLGFSHDVSVRTEAVIIDRRRITDITKIAEVHSVDVVADPSAGGRIERLVASRQEEEPMELVEFLRALRAGELTEAQVQEAYGEHPEWEQVVEAAQAEPPAPPPAPPAPPAPASDTVVATRLTPAVRQMVIATQMEARHLPEAARERLEETLAGIDDEETIVARIAETADVWSAALAARPAPLPGQGPSIEVTQDEVDKKITALEAMIANQPEAEDGTPAYRSIKQAYADFTGRNPYLMGDEDFNRWLLAESAGGVPYGGSRLMESVATTTWAEAFGDSIRRRMIAEYQLSELSSWRLITSEIGNLPDFRTNRRVRLGGYDLLPVVAEGAPYQPLITPGDEEATYVGSKKGGLEDYTLEAIANDDLGALRRIPRALGRAAALTLYRAIWNVTIAANATIYDGVALFHASHNNTTAATPLAEAGVQTLRTKMIRQTQPGETSGFVGLRPRILAVPPELFVTAFKLAESAQAVVGSAESATTPNPWKGLMVIEVPTFTDVNDWFLVADPNSVPTIEVGFYQGRQDPELFIQDQPTVGSVFTADKFTWKIRHIWGLTVLDYRGFQRGEG